ncbi:MAG: hypothetical protein JWM16_2564 [Verrucomicrobiales bacterium]|nr:hypothetical protein [Verrucomicrobiales bacterium]
MRLPEPPRKPKFPKNHPRIVIPSFWFRHFCRGRTCILPTFLCVENGNPIQHATFTPCLIYSSLRNASHERSHGKYPTQISGELYPVGFGYFGACATPLSNSAVARWFGSDLCAPEDICRLLIPVRPANGSDSPGCMAHPDLADLLEDLPELWLAIRKIAYLSLLLNRVQCLDPLDRE